MSASDRFYAKACDIHGHGTSRAHSVCSLCDDVADAISGAYHLAIEQAAKIADAECEVWNLPKRSPTDCTLFAACNAIARQVRALAEDPAPGAAK